MPVYDTVTLALDEHSLSLVYTIGSSTSWQPCTQGFVAPGHAILMLDNILAAAMAQNPALAAPGATLEGV